MDSGEVNFHEIVDEEDTFVNPTVENAYRVQGIVQLAPLSPSNLVNRPQGFGLGKFRVS
jgi:hypothetical protein